MCAYAYITASALVHLVVALFTDPSWRLLNELWLLYLFGSIVGVLPAMLLGGVTGLLLAGLIALFGRSLTPPYAAGIGVAVSVLLSVGIHLIVVRPDRIETLLNGSYVFFIGVPSVVYIVAGGWMGRRLYRQRSDRIQ